MNTYCFAEDILFDGDNQLLEATSLFPYARPEFEFDDGPSG